MYDKIKDLLDGGDLITRDVYIEYCGAYYVAVLHGIGKARYWDDGREEHSDVYDEQVFDEILIKRINESN